VRRGGSPRRPLRRIRGFGTASAMRAPRSCDPRRSVMRYAHVGHAIRARRAGHTRTSGRPYAHVGQAIRARRACHPRTSGGPCARVGPVMRACSSPVPSGRAPRDTLTSHGIRGPVAHDMPTRVPEARWRVPRCTPRCPTILAWVPRDPPSCVRRARTRAPWSSLAPPTGTHAPPAGTHAPPTGAHAPWASAALRPPMARPRVTDTHAPIRETRSRIRLRTA
jgi:hypothetical protein